MGVVFQYDRFLSYRIIFHWTMIMGERVTWHLKMDGWNTMFVSVWDDLIFRCDNVCFRIYILRKKKRPLNPPQSSMGYSQGWLKNEAIDRMKTFHRLGCFSNYRICGIDPFFESRRSIYSWVYRWILSSPTQNSCHLARIISERKTCSKGSFGGPVRETHRFGVSPRDGCVFFKCPSEPTEPSSPYAAKNCFIASTLQVINISHLGKRKIIFKHDFWWDMLVP